MGQVERDQLAFWCGRVVRDPEMLAQDPRGARVGDIGFALFEGEHPTTFCNVAAQRICRGMGYDMMDGMTADGMHDYMAKNWISPYGSTQDKMRSARTAALIGDLAILSYKHDPHGHVAVVAPDPAQLYSGKWGVYVPKVANVGGVRKDGASANDIVSANYAFSELPDVYVLGRVLA